MCEVKSRDRENDDGLREEGGEPAPRDNHLPQNRAIKSTTDLRTSRQEEVVQSRQLNKVDNLDNLEECSRGRRKRDYTMNRRCGLARSERKEGEGEGAKEEGTVGGQSDQDQEKDKQTSEG